MLFLFGVLSVLSEFYVKYVFSEGFRKLNNKAMPKVLLLPVLVFEIDVMLKHVYYI